MNAIAATHYPFPSRTALERVCKKNNISYLGLFGSTARGDDQPDSDIDLLYEFDERKSLFDLVHVHEDLSKMLKKKVQLVSRKTLKPRIRPYVQKDLITLYEERSIGLS